MKNITFVTTNKGKYNSAKKVLADYNIDVIHKNISLPESQDGSLEEIATNKAIYAYNLVHSPLLTMDAGFFIPSLHEFPGIFAHYVVDTLGVEGLLRLTQDKDKSAEFREVLCYLESPEKEPKLFYRVVKGRLSNQIRGKLHAGHWSELALVFIPQNYTQTMAEMSQETFEKFQREVDSNSHWEQFARFFSSE